MSGHGQKKTLRERFLEAQANEKEHFFVENKRVILELAQTLDQRIEALIDWMNRPFPPVTAWRTGNYDSVTEYSIGRVLTATNTTIEAERLKSTEEYQALLRACQKADVFLEMGSHGFDENRVGVYGLVIIPYLSFDKSPDASLLNKKRPPISPQPGQGA